MKFNGLALLFIRKEIHVSGRETLNKFASVSKNLDFVLFLYTTKMCNKN